MRVLCLFFTLCGGMAAVGAQPGQPFGDWSSCVESLTLPTDSTVIPFLPLGVFSVEARLNFGTRPTPTINLRGDTKNVGTAVEVSLAASKFHSVKCNGRSVVLLFQFNVEGPRVSAPPLSWVEVKPPNRFVIHYRAQLPFNEIEPPPPPPPTHDGQR